MEWLMDPTAWAGLATLVVLEVVLGIDNLIFIAILSDKLPPDKRQRARVVGLLLALGMRIVLLASISALTTLTEPLFSVMGKGLSGRDLIMLLGGGFLLFKGTMELHEKLEPDHKKTGGAVNYAGFWQVIVQIVVLDAVFSLDAVITAVGMTPHVEVAMIAVCIAIALMIWASTPLMNFVSRHPTVVILCLGFLLMIGFSLVVEGLGYHIPKGYLYAAIGFSVVIEAFNQTAQHNRRKVYDKIDPRTRMASAVLALMGGGARGDAMEHRIGELAAPVPDMEVFKPQERLMINRVLQLADQSVQSIMTPRQNLYWIDAADDMTMIMKEIRECPYSCVIVARDGKVDEPLGIIHKKEVADLYIQGRTRREDLKSVLRQPLYIPETMTTLEAMDTLRKSRVHQAFIIDEYGTMEGFITLTDLAEAIAGDMPEDHEEDNFTFQKLGRNSYLINGRMALHDLAEIIGPFDGLEGDYNTAAGIALEVLKRLPQKGDVFEFDQWTVTVMAMDGLRVSRLRFAERAPKAPEAGS